MYPEKELRGLSQITQISTIHIHLFVRDLYIPRIGLPILLQEKMWTDPGIYKSLTDTRMWKLGLRPRNSFSGNTYGKWKSHCSVGQES